jgi:hypothetical protein
MSLVSENQELKIVRRLIDQLTQIDELAELTQATNQFLHEDSDFRTKYDKEFNQKLVESHAQTSQELAQTNLEMKQYLAEKRTELFNRLQAYMEETLQNLPEKQRDAFQRMVLDSLQDALTLDLQLDIRKTILQDILDSTQKLSESLERLQTEKIKAGHPGNGAQN